MKALTIWQPWASLLAYGAKKYETRSWSTKYRGPIAIHAATIKVPQVLKKLFPYDECDGMAKSAFLDAVAKGLCGVYTTEELMETLNALPTGAVVATANLIGCHKMRSPSGFRLLKYGDTPFIRREDGRTSMPDKVEIALGDWKPGRWAWEFSDMRLIDPIPTKGKQGLWKWDEQR